MLEVVLLGPPRVRHTSGAAVSLSPAATSLLAFVVLHGGCSRDAMAAAFCGDVPDDVARRRLNTSLWRLRKALGPGSYVTSGTNAVGVAADDMWVDATDFESRVTPALHDDVRAMSDGDAKALADAVSLYTGDLLEGAYDDWVLRERDRLSELHLTALARLVVWYERRDAASALQYAKAILGRDPLREDVHRAVMRAYAGLGRREEALHQYDECVRLLAGELDLTPLPETTALATSIARGESHDAPLRPEAKTDVVRRLREAQRQLTSLRDEVQRAIDDLTR